MKYIDRVIYIYNIHIINIKLFLFLKVKLETIFPMRVMESEPAPGIKHTISVANN